MLLEAQDLNPKPKERNLSPFMAIPKPVCSEADKLIVSGLWTGLRYLSLQGT